MAPLLYALLLLGPVPAGSEETYRNPVLFGDYSDPDVLRAEDGFYLVSSSFNAVPALPVLFSPDLVSWTIVGHAAERLPSPAFDTPQHGKGVWAPSLRFHDGHYWIFYGDPDLGIFMTRARNPRGPWEPLVLVQEAKGWIDPCPLWDDDGQAWLVHAWAKSRAGFNSVLTVHRMSADGRRILDEGRMVFDGHERQPTIEGPKLYKRNGYYYIFAPAGGVERGWQAVLRSKQVFGPYEDRIVMDQGTTAVNGPHQGAWIDTAEGESWFVHFQDRGAYGRIVHLQPLRWRDDWPVIGEDRDGDGKGQPVLSWARPRLPAPAQLSAPQTTDEFESRLLGLQWQWQANPSPGWWSLAERAGVLRLRAVPAATGRVSLWEAPNLLLQKLPAPAFVATARLEAEGLRVGEQAGLVVFGLDYAALVVRRTAEGLRLALHSCRDADRGTPESEGPAVALASSALLLRVAVEPEALCRFSFSRDGRSFEPLGEAFAARAGRWVGAKLGLFAVGPQGARAPGHADFDWLRIE